MNYANYDEKIVLLHEVRLDGWPLERFCSPADVVNLTDMRKLRNALRSGVCRWKRLSAAELKAHAESIERRRESGKVVGRSRKKRSDAGVQRGKRRRADNSGANKENEGPSLKRQKQGQASTLRKPAPHKNTKKKSFSSREFIGLSDEDKDEDTDEDDINNENAHDDENYSVGTDGPRFA